MKIAKFIGTLIKDLFINIILPLFVLFGGVYLISMIPDATLDTIGWIAIGILCLGVVCIFISYLTETWNKQG